jgi:hypothetical protein
MEISRSPIARDTCNPVPRKAIETIIDAATKPLGRANHQLGEYIAVNDRPFILWIDQLSRAAWVGG